MSGYYEGSWNWVATFRDPISGMVYDIRGGIGFATMEQARQNLFGMMTSGELFEQTKVTKDWADLGAEMVWTNDYGR